MAYQPLTDEEFDGQNKYTGPKLDRPSLRSREAALRLSAGMATPEDIRRLAKRQGIEARAAARAMREGFSPNAAIRESIEPYLANSRISTGALRAGRAQTALAEQTALANAEVLPARTAAERAQARALQKEAEFQTSEDAKVLKDAEVAAAAARSAEALGALKTAPLRQQVAQAELEEQARLLETVTIPTAEEPAGGRPPAAAKPEPVALEQRLGSRLPIVDEDPTEVAKREVSRRYGGQKMTLRQLNELEGQFKPSQQKITVVDPLTQASYEVDVLADSSGNVYRQFGYKRVSDSAQTKADESYATNFSKWLEGTDRANLVNRTQELRRAIEILEDPKTKLASGPLISILPDWAADRVRSDRSLSARDAILTSVQQTLRETLGAQFTQKEGEALMNRAFNPKASEEENARRAKVILKQATEILDARERAADYFSRYGTLGGFKGPKVLNDEDAFRQMEGVVDQLTGSAPGGAAGAQPGERSRKALDSYFQQLYPASKS